MPRFYLDVSVGDDFTRDDVGFDYDSMEISEHEVTRAAAEISLDALPRRRTSEARVQVRDKDGYLLLTVDVSMTVRRTIRALV